MKALKIESTKDFKPFSVCLPISGYDWMSVAKALLIAYSDTSPAEIDVILNKLNDDEYSAAYAIIGSGFTAEVAEI